MHKQGGRLGKIIVALSAVVVLAAGAAWLFRDAPWFNSSELNPSALDPAAPPPPRATSGISLGNFSLSDPPKPVPAVSFTMQDGAPADLNRFHGKVVLVNLWATWCVPCREEMPELDRLAAEMQGPDFAVVALAEDRGGWDKAKAFLDEIGASHVTLYLDQTMKSGRAWGAPGLPVTLLIDREGREVARVLGPAKWGAPATRSLIRNAIEKKSAG